MNILTYKTADSKNRLTSRAGLAVVCELLKSLKLSEMVDRLMPKGKRNLVCSQTTNVG